MGLCAVSPWREGADTKAKRDFGSALQWPVIDNTAATVANRCTAARSFRKLAHNTRFLQLIER
jgi:hypothetical protein